MGLGWGEGERESLKGHHSRVSRMKRGWGRGLRGPIKAKRTSCTKAQKHEGEQPTVHPGYGTAKDGKDQQWKPGLIKRGFYTEGQEKALYGFRQKSNTFKLSFHFQRLNLGTVIGCFPPLAFGKRREVWKERRKEGLSGKRLCSTQER